MQLQTTTDPITLRDVKDSENHPCLYEGDGENGLAIRFENEENTRICMEMELEYRTCSRATPARTMQPEAEPILDCRYKKSRTLRLFCAPNLRTR